MIRWPGFLRARRLPGRTASGPAKPLPPAPQGCGHCRHFRNAPAEMEAALPGLASLSSGHASVRGDDGLCGKHDRFVTATSICGAFQARSSRFGGLASAP